MEKVTSNPHKQTLSRTCSGETPAEGKNFVEIDGTALLRCRLLKQTNSVKSE
jgi:hypothetical protein